MSNRDARNAMRRPEAQVHDETIIGAIREVLMFWVVTLACAALITLVLGAIGMATARGRSKSRSGRGGESGGRQRSSGSGRGEGQGTNSDTLDEDSRDGDAPDEGSAGETRMRRRSGGTRTTIGR